MYAITENHKQMSIGPWPTKAAAQEALRGIRDAAPLLASVRTGSIKSGKITIGTYVYQITTYLTPWVGPVRPEDDESWEDPETSTDEPAPPDPARYMYTAPRVHRSRASYTPGMRKLVNGRPRQQRARMRAMLRTARRELQADGILASDKAVA